MPMSTDQLVGPAVRAAFERFVTHVKKKYIHLAWQGAGFSRTEADPAALPERVSLFKAYCDSVDWHDRTQVAAALHALRDIVYDAADAIDVASDPSGEQEWKGWVHRLHQAVEREHLTIDDDNLIHLPASVGLSDEVWDGIQEPETIKEYLHRLQTAIVNEDPALVIGLSKELTESTAKVALTALNVDYRPKDSLNNLVNKVREELGLHHVDQPGPDAAPGSRRATNGINKALSGATNVVIGLDEFRNAAGTGHGRARTVPGLGARHARLAVDAATLWCNLVLATLADQQAPWRKHG